VYVPPHFAVENLAQLNEAIAQFPFATIVTNGEAGIVASHVPVLLDLEPAPYGTLLFHFARANPHWSIAARAETLVMFLGPHAYVSPAWYATTHETGKVVPTWNYVAIHAYGHAAAFDDPERLRELVTRLTNANEEGRPSPWAVDDAPREFIDSQLKGIVGLRMPIERLEGKWKMSQNRPPADVAGAIGALEGSERQDDRATAQIMASLLGLHGKPSG
jgi:transcriptional regulator